MKPIYPTELEYVAEAKWDGSTGGFAETGDFRVSFDTPPEYGGKGSAFCPDQLFLAALGGCLLNTFISFMNRLGAEVLDISVTTSCRVELKDHRYVLTAVRAEIRVVSAVGMEKISQMCADLAVEHCHLTRLIDTVVPIDWVIRVVSEQT
jgi:organic hydroperoxide reductase OsmC/OhrA